MKSGNISRAKSLSVDYTSSPIQGFFVFNKISGEWEERKVKIKKERTFPTVSKRYLAPEGLAYTDFQNTAIEFALSRKDTLIADEMGLGKTIETIGVINTDQTLNKILIVTTASLKENWKDELELWLMRDLSIFIVGKKTKQFPKSQIVIINYDILEKWEDDIEKYRWDLLVLDESHYIKNSGSLRAQVVTDLRNRFSKRIFLTGTPVLSRPIELWTTIHIMKPEGLPTKKWKYGIKYCEGERGEYGWNFKGASNLQELRKKLLSTIMIRRTKREVMKEFPKKVRQVISLSSEGIRERIQEEQALLTVLRGKEKKLQFSEISRARHQTAIIKIPYVLSYVEDTLENLDKVVVFAYHHCMIDGLREGLAKKKIPTVILDGRVKVTDRMSLVKKFRDMEKGVFLGQIRTAGMGISLVTASTAILAELDWVPGWITQAEDRLWRYGQKNFVHIIHLVFQGSIDSRLVKVLIRKQQIVNKILDGTGCEDGNAFYEFLRTENLF